MRVVVSASLSSNYDTRSVILEEATGDVLDDAQGYGYQSAHNAHQPYSSTSMPPKKKRRREVVQRQVERCCAEHEKLMPHVDQAMLYALKDGENGAQAGVRAILTEHGVELACPVKDLMKQW